MRLVRCLSNYPPHTVVGLPALSPTMTHGNLAQWRKKEGEEIAPGDVICEIETDKATVDFEAQDEGIVAKILVKDGTSDIPVGSPIMVLVEEASSVAAFADFAAPAAAAPKAAEAPAAAPAPPAPTPPPPPKAASPPPPPPTPAPAPRKAAAPAPPAPAPVPATGPLPEAQYAFKRWGSFSRDGPLSKRLTKLQKEYVKAYGSTLSESF